MSNFLFLSVLCIFYLNFFRLDFQRLILFRLNKQCQVLIDNELSCCLLLLEFDEV